MSNKIIKCSKCLKSLPYLECDPSFFCYFINGKTNHYCDDCLPENFLEMRIKREHFNCKEGKCHNLRNSMGKSSRLYWDNGIPKSECYMCGGGRILGKNGEEIIECKHCDKKFCSFVCMSHAPKCQAQLKNNNQKPIKPTEPDQNQKPNKSNCNCQSIIRDKIQDWEVNLKAKVLKDCQNGNCIGSDNYKRESNWEEPFLCILTEKCACGSVMFGNKYGDKMVECSKCWKSKSNSQKQDINSHKRKGEELDSEREPKKLHYDSDKSPVSKIGFVNNEKSDSENNSKEPNNKTLIINLKTIKKITLISDGNLVIEFNSNDKSETQIITNKQITNSQELQKAKNYLQKENKNSISQQEFNSLINTNSTTPTSTKKPKNNHALLIGGGIAVLVVGVVIGLLVRNGVKKSKLKR